MKQLTQTQACIFVFGALLMVVGAATYVLSITPLLTRFADPSTSHRIGAVVYSIGAVCFASMQIIQRYEGTDFTISRLRKIQIIGDCFFLAAALLLLENAFLFVYPLFLRGGVSLYNFYLQYIHNNWVVLLLIAAILELYTTHRIARLIKKT
ncbi:MAG: hypothetical protein HUK08_03590 [Bacteroidaceae bacterium]|nr:hypothetical protein [Bacteroidaceae bacterium]